MRPRFTRFAFVLVAVVSLANCRSVENRPLDKARAGSIKTVAMLGISESKAVGLRDFSGFSGLGGAVGGAISGATDADRSKAFVAEYNRRKVRLASSMADALQQDLAKSGLEVLYLQNERPKLKDGADDYSHISTPANAILNVWFGPIGYVYPRFSTTYEPWMMVNARLVNGKTKEVLYRKTFSAGYETIIANTVFVPCSKTVRFSSYDALMGNYEQAIEALSDCQKAVAQQIVTDLK